ncbi:MAG: lytic transglycosylase domain-containing protein [Endomicrobiales bacterium]
MKFERSIFRANALMISLLVASWLVSGACALSATAAAPGIGTGADAFAAREDGETALDPDTDALDEAGEVPEGREQGRDDDALSRRKIKEAEILYRDAVRSHEHGNNARAQELYERSLAVLSEARIGAAAYYGVKDDFALLFNKLDKACAVPGTEAAADGPRYSIPLEQDNELVRKYLKAYTGGAPGETIRKALARSGRYRDMILPILKEYDLPEELVYLPVVESLYNNNDLSRAGALGLWQLMPDRARALGLKVNYWIDERRDPEKSTRAAARYLKQLFIMFDDWHLALAAYNRGENGLVRDLKFSNATNIGEMSGRNAVPRETQNYVPQFIVCTLIGENPEKYGCAPEYEKPRAFDEVTVNAVTDLKVAAKCAGTTVETLRELNPALKAWCTPHNYPGFILRLPAGTREAFAGAIALEKDLNPTRGYVKYRVVKGDSLSKIAKKFSTTTASIREDNRIKDSRKLKISQTLVIRPGRKYFAAR